MKIKRILSSSGGMNALSSLFAIILGLLAGFIILLVSNPSQAVAGFVTILTGGFSDMFNIGQVLYYSMPIIMTGLSVGFAGKTGLFNIGASGQFTFGMYAAVLAAVKCSFLPNPLRCAAAIIAGMLAGAIWGLIPGMLKALRNVHEVIACIMMNYIGMYLVNHLIRVTGIFDQLRNTTVRVPSGANMPSLGLNNFFSTKTAQGSIRPSSLGSGILIAIAACILLYIVLEKTKLGYELKSCGFNREAARYAGINENRGIMLSMAIAGGLSGLGGALVVLAGAGRGISVVDVLAGEGFQGIPVALLGLYNPIGILFSGILIAHLTQGGFLLQRLAFAPEIIDIIVAVIIYFSALALLFKNILSYIFRDKNESPQIEDDDEELEDDEASEADETNSLGSVEKEGELVLVESSLSENKTKDNNNETGGEPGDS
ncbi:MAG: ABC transporter permease [Oscillospiraceae bacterium]|nr:ABC transporter permease [Oscillospiraceae bacterium]